MRSRKVDVGTGKENKKNQSYGIHTIRDRSESATYQQRIERKLGKVAVFLRKTPPLFQAENGGEPKPVDAAVRKEGKVNQSRAGMTGHYA